MATPYSPRRGKIIEQREVTAGACIELFGGRSPDRAFGRNHLGTKLGAILGSGEVHLHEYSAALRPPGLKPPSNPIFANSSQSQQKPPII